ncbi:hypothetical protein Glittering_12 [Bacillus phage Glittering]|uniref:Uncharacterized protein n=1 Tax=Bacillus phage Glittering TaxID=2884421 RepID=U5PTJ0_9CAUD|nr:hypothetical protein Glittering_12 [Bacillus phage Glittering]AGY47199.1 hypothetical protein Glittering_12 [Bacillus phage Glittering]
MSLLKSILKSETTKRVAIKGIKVGLPVLLRYAKNKRGAKKR